MSKGKVMIQTFYFLHGEDAVAELYENGADGCKKRGFNCTSKIECFVSGPLELFIKKILGAVAGSLETCLISKEDFELLKAV